MRLWLGDCCGLGTVMAWGLAMVADLYGHSQTRGHMGDPHGTVGGVDVLPARSRGAIRVDTDVLIFHLHVHLQHSDCHLLAWKGEMGRLVH